MCPHRTAPRPSGRRGPAPLSPMSTTGWRTDGWSSGHLGSTGRPAAAPSDAGSRSSSSSGRPASPSVRRPATRRSSACGPTPSPTSSGRSSSRRRRTSSSCSASAPPAHPRRRTTGGDGWLAVDRGRIDWWATAIQLAGTVFFNFTTFDALDASTSPRGSRPRGVDAGRAGIDLLPRRQPARLCRGWPQVAVMAAAGPGLADRRDEPAGVGVLRHLGAGRLGRPATGDLLNAALDTAGTFWGAVCFLIGAALLLVPPRRA